MAKTQCLLDITPYNECSIPGTQYVYKVQWTSRAACVGKNCKFSRRMNYIKEISVDFRQTLTAMSVRLSIVVTMISFVNLFIVVIMVTIL